MKVCEYYYELWLVNVIQILKKKSDLVKSLTLCILYTPRDQGILLV